MLSGMFTGLIQHLGSVLAVEPAAGMARDSVGAGRSMRVNIAVWSHAPEYGESIAVNGCCLTVAEVSDAALRFDVISQTLAVTALGDLRAGDQVNLEHSVTPTTMLGGHIVQGHIDSVGVVRRVTTDATQHRLRIAPPQADAMRLIVDKGSIAVNGVSLTVSEAGDDWFDVALIPTTLQMTNLGALRNGARVNLEYDYIAKVVANWLERRAL